MMPPRNIFHVFCWIFIFFLSSASSSNWQENIRPKLFAKLSQRDFQSFSGTIRSNGGGDANESTSSSTPINDFFSLMLYTHMTDEALVVGARNIVYKLTVDELRLKQTLSWDSLEVDRDTCTVKGKTLNECQNYIKVLLQYQNEPNQYLICGTNAYKPSCRIYKDERGSYELKIEKPGLGSAPFSPWHNSTAVLVGEHVFAGTAADMGGIDPIIYVDYKDPLRTPQYDSTQLNSPDFVGSFAHRDFVYFFFREGAVEHTNCGKTVFSRVARVCKDDTGGPNRAKNLWTSFLKARLNCSVPGDYPFYFDEIQAVSHLIEGQYGHGAIENNIEEDKKDAILYASFSTAPNAIGGSAVCAFRLRQISDAFGGAFKEQRDMSANWLPVPDHKVPQPRPGTCSNDTKSLPDSYINFVKKHSLMDDSVPPFFGSPILIRTGLISRFTSIAVDPQVGTTDGKTFDVIFVGTTKGRVIKAINAKSADSRNEVETVVVEELQVFDSDVVIKELKVMGGGLAGRKSLGRLAIMSELEIRSVAVQRCDRATTCGDCVALQDPYCAWDIRASRCSSGDWTSNMANSYLQAVVSGKHSQCPPVGSPKSDVKMNGEMMSNSAFLYSYGFDHAPLGQVVNIVDSQHPQEKQSRTTGGQSGTAGTESQIPGNTDDGVEVIESQVLFSLETLIITVSAGAVAALVVGFVTGFCCGKQCRKDDGTTLVGHLGYPDTEYEYFEQRGGLARPTYLGPTLTTAGPTLGGPGAPLLPQETAKLDNRHEEVTYAEPELVTGLQGYSGGPLIGGGGPVGPGVIGMSGPTSMPNSRYVGAGDLGSGPRSHYTSSLLTGGPSKFNTIHSSVNKRSNNSAAGAAMALNHYESAGPPLGVRPPGGNVMVGGNGNAAYHLSTLGRSSSVRGGRDPLLPTSSGSSSTGSGSGQSSGLKNPQAAKVVDSAYGTTRSSKKVYL